MTKNFNYFKINIKKLLFFFYMIDKMLNINLIAVIGLKVLNGDIILGVLRLLKVNGLEFTGWFNDNLK
jgi:hypothetical protein